MCLVVEVVKFHFQITCNISIYISAGRYTLCLFVIIWKGSNVVLPDVSTVFLFSLFVMNIFDGNGRDLNLLFFRTKFCLAFIVDNGCRKADEVLIIFGATKSAVLVWLPSWPWGKSIGRSIHRQSAPITSNDGKIILISGEIHPKRSLNGTLNW